MGIRRMIDTDNPPVTVAGWEVLFTATGADCAGLYVPANGQPHGWGHPAKGCPPEALAALAQVKGAGLLPILVPNASTSQNLDASAMAIGAQLAAEWARSGGFTEAGGVALDIEAGWSSADLAYWTAVSAAFYQGGNRVGVVPVQYGSVAFLRHLAGLPATERVEAVWCGEYPTGQQQPAGPQECPGLAGDWVSAGQKGWQWKGTTQEAGYSVDLSVIDLPLFAVPAPAPPPPPPPPPATPEQLVAGRAYLTPKGDTLTLS